MKRTSHAVNARGSGGFCPAEIIRPPNQRAKLAIGTALLLLLQLSVTNSFAAPTTIVHPDFTTPIIDPAGQQPAAGSWANVIPNALASSFTFTPYNPAAALTAGFPASANCGTTEDCYTITIQQAVQQLGLIDNGTAGNPLLPTTIYGYGSATNGGSLWHAPGMTFRNTSNVPTRITWLNQLPNLQPPGFDPTYCGPTAPDCFPYNRIVTHVHGAHVLDDSDGIPEQWYTPDFAVTGSDYKPSTYGPLGTYRYPNTQEAATIWYHDHATGLTHLNTQMGMAGFYLITDNNEKCLEGFPGIAGCPGGTPKSLPTDPYEIGFAMQDRSFWPSGDFALPDQPIRDLLSPACTIDPATGLVIPTTCPTVPFSKAADGHLIPYSATAPQPGPFTATSGTLEYFGNIPMVNGVVYGKYDVEPRVYRMRFIGGTDSRTYVMQLEDRAAPGVPIPFWQIGSEQGMLNNPVSRTSIDLMPGERIDVLVDLKTAVVGHKLVLKNIGPDTPYGGPFAAATPSVDIPEIMEFNVIALNSVIADVASPTAALNLRPVNGPIAALTPTAGTPVRNVSLIETIDQYGRTMPTIDNRGFMTMGMAPTEIIKFNDVEQWDIINTTVDAHPMHLHLVAFQLINRQLIDPASFVPPVSDVMNQIYKQPSYANAAGSQVVLPSAWEAGWKDTIDCPPGYVTRIKAKFDIEGAYVFHCHILSHEEHDMMRPMMVHKHRVNADFDGDGKTDVAFWNPATGTWKIKASQGLTSFTVAYSLAYGTTGDKPVAGDYDNDGKNEIAVFRPSNGYWYIRNTNGTQTIVPYGTAGDTPVPGDYDGDGKTDIAVWRPSSGLWYVKNSLTGTQSFLQYGTSGDIPVPGDYDGDGKTDKAVWRPSTGNWYVMNSLAGTQNMVHFGTTGDIPVPGDYDGDGKTDIAVWRPSSGFWYIINSATGAQTVRKYGTTGDIPVPGDYSNIGRTDIAVWRPSTGNLYIIDSATGTQRISASGGLATDQPVKSGQPIQ